ncbi:MAG: M56 family metallopeptidase, partial [Steroidobacteraceae bacterium]
MIEQTGFLLPIASWVLFSSLKSIAIIPLVLLIRRVFTKWLTPQARYGLWFALIACLTIPFGAQVDLRGTPRATEVPVPVHAASRANAANYEKPVIGISTAAVTSSFQPSPRTVAILVWVLGVAVLAAAVLRNAARYSRMSFTASEPDAATTRLFEHCTQIVKIRRHVRLLETSGVDSPLLVGYWRPALLLPRNLSSHINREQLRMVLLHELTHVGRHDILVNWLITCVQIAHWFNPLAWYALRIARNDMEQACDAGVLRHLTTAEQLEYGNTLIRLSDMTPRQALLVQNASVVESRSQLKERISMIARFKPLGTASSILGATLIALTSIVACTQGADAPQQPAKPAVQLATAAVVEQAA